MLAHKDNIHNTQSGWRIVKRSFNPLPPFFPQAQIQSSMIIHNTRHCVVILSIVLVTTMNIGRKVETTLELLERLTRQARERQDALDSDLDSEASSEIGQEVEEEKAKEEKVERNDKAEGKKRKLDSEIKVCERYNEEDANITLISSDSVAFKVHSFILLRAS